MADYYAIIFDLTTSWFESAAMEMTSSGSGSATFTVYTQGGSSSSASTNFNANRYLSSQSSSISNLFTPSNKATAMVKASSSVGTSAFLRQWSGTHALGYMVPPSTVTLGSEFHVPSSNNVTVAKLLLGNPDSTNNVTVSLYYGSSVTADSSHVLLPHGFAVVQLSNPQQRVRLTCDSSREFFVQLAVELNSEYDVSFVTPV